jgi:hypothetical protein
VLKNSPDTRLGKPVRNSEKCSEQIGRQAYDGEHDIELCKGLNPGSVIQWFCAAIGLSPATPGFDSRHLPEQETSLS